MKRKINLVCAIVLMASVFQSCKKNGIEDEMITQQPQTPASLSLPSNDVPLTINGTQTFQQVPWSTNYVIGGESILIPGDHTLSTPNPILSEMNKYTDYASNVPLDLVVSNPSSNSWYQQYTYTFTNRSNKTLHVDAGIIMFIAPKNSNADRYYGSTSKFGFGHPQQDYVEVPIAGTPNSWYIARLVFHDVPENNRSIEPGASWLYKLGTPTDPNNNPGWITTQQSRKTVRFIADLTGNKNEDIVRKYGTKRFRN